MNKFTVWVNQFNVDSYVGASDMLMTPKIVKNVNATQYNSALFKNSLDQPINMHWRKKFFFIFNLFIYCSNVQEINSDHVVNIMDIIKMFSQ